MFCYTQLNQWERELFGEAADEIFKKFLLNFFLGGNGDNVKTSLNLTLSLNHLVNNRK